MAFTVPNEAAAAFADQAEPDSQDLSILQGAPGLNGVMSGCAVTAQGSPDMTVAVAAGQVIVAGVQATVTAGNVTITTADATNPRFDLICVNSSGTKSAVAGTPAANAVFPDPAGKVVLAAVYVPANDTTIASNQVTDKRVSILPWMGLTDRNVDAARYGAVEDDYYEDGVATGTQGTVTATAATNLLTRTSHGLVANDKVTFKTTTTLPAPLAVDTVYYVISSGLTANDFKVSTSQGGAEVDITDAGTGTHTVVPVFTSATANFTAGDVGKTIVVLRAGPSQYQDLHTTIASVLNSTTCTFTDGAGRDQSQCRFYISRAGDQTAAIQAALNACGDNGGGRVILSGVGYLITGVELPNRVWLMGMGHHATMLHMMGGNNRPVVRNKQVSNNSAQSCIVSDLWIDGNRLRQTDQTTTTAGAWTGGTQAGTLSVNGEPPLSSGHFYVSGNKFSYTSYTGSGPYTLQNVYDGVDGTTSANLSSGSTITWVQGHGVYLAPLPDAANPTFADSTDVPMHLVKDVYIKNVRGDGVMVSGWSEVRLRNVYAHYADHVGIRPSFDTFTSDSTAETCGRAGFVVRGSSQGGSNNKAYFNGGNVPAEGFGFVFEGPAVTEEGCRQWLGCNAQDNKSDGFLFNRCQRAIVSGSASSNGTSGADGTYVGVRLQNQSTQNIIDMVCTERGLVGGVYPQRNALMIVDAASAQNKIRLSHAASAGATVGSAIKAGSDLSAGNDIQINGMNGHTSATVSGSYTPDPYLATTHKLALTGNATINLPANAHLNCPLTFTFTQDATGGRTVTWNAAFIPGAWTVNPAPNGRSSITFTYDGTNWITTSYTNSVISRGGSVLNPTGAVNVYVWRAPFACTVTNVRGIRRGGSAATINARRNGTSNHLASNLSLSTADTWTDGGAVQNTAYAAGDSLEIMVVSVTGPPTEIGIQVDFARS